MSTFFLVQKMTAFKKYLYLVLLVLLVSCSATDLQNLYPTVQPTETALVQQTNTPKVTDTPKPTPTPQTCTVTAAESLNLRAGAGTQYSVTNVLRAGDILTLVNVPARGEWLQVTTESGVTGWINSHYCE